jgi:hypothetical protein
MLKTLDKLPGNAVSYIGQPDWDRMVQHLGAGYSKIQLQDLFYPEKESQSIDQSRQRRPGFLVSLDDNAFEEVCDYLAEEPGVKFPDIHRLTSLSSNDGRILPQVLEHVLDWLSVERTPSGNKRDNKKPPYRVDLIQALQHFNVKLLRQAKKRVSILFLESEQEQSYASNASIVMQQEILEFAFDHLDAFKTSDMRQELAQRLEVGNDRLYGKRFARKEWAHILGIVRWYMQSTFRPEWQVYTDDQPTSRERGDALLVQQDLTKALMEFATEEAGTIDRTILKRAVYDPGFTAKLGQWLVERYDEDYHRQDRAKPTGDAQLATVREPNAAVLEQANARAGSANDTNDRLDNNAFRRVESAVGPNDEEESATNVGVTQEKRPMLTAWKQAETQGREKGARHPLPMSRSDLQITSSPVAPSSGQGGVKERSKASYDAPGRVPSGSMERIAGQNLMLQNSPVTRPSQGAWRKGNKAIGNTRRR